jgi:SNF2 family DNA or RNA helicase
MRLQEKGPIEGGILADDRGLGKPLQALSLIYTRARKASPSARHKPTLIVAPTTVLPVWIKECRVRFGDELNELHRLVPEIRSQSPRSSYFGHMTKPAARGGHLLSGIA